VDAQAGTEQADDKPAYTTSKQVQAWFLGRSRDRWKNKATQKNAEIKRLRQRADDVEASRAHWRAKAEAAQHEVERLQGEAAQLQARLDRLAQEASQKKRPNCPA
jgi:chromosome segregation ATPase